MTQASHVVLPLPHLHSAVIAVALHGGPRYEGEEQTGRTHFLEHMLFRGAGERSHSDLMAAFEAVGSEPSAYTAEDLLMIVLELDPERLADGARLLAEILTAPRFEDLEAERAIILEERLERVDADEQPTDPADLAAALTFPQHPLGRSILGRKRDVRRLDAAGLEAWRKRIVNRSNVAVAVAGAVDPVAATAALTPLLALPAGDPLADAGPLPPPAGPALASHREDEAQAELRLSLRGPGEADPRFPALEILVDLLDGGPTARLPTRLVDAGLAYDASIDLTELPDVSLLGVQLSLAPSKLGRGLDVLGELLGSLVEGVDPDELARSAVRRRHAQRRRWDDPEGLAEWAARRLLHGLPTDAATVDAALDAVTAEEVQALAAELFDPANLSLVVIGPGRKQRRVAKGWMDAWRPGAARNQLVE